MPPDPHATVWLPFPVEELGGGVPEGLDIRWWDGREPLPDGLLDAAFLVPAYLDAELAIGLLPRMGSLQVVQTLTAGVDSVRPHVPEGVTLCNARGVHDASTAELAVALILASLRGIPEFVRSQAAATWEPFRATALADSRVLVVGYGSIGAALERRLDGFACEVVRVARRARQVEAGPVHALGDLPGLLPDADVVVLLVPMTAETTGLVDAAFLAAMKDGALLINVSRGAVVDTGALLAELGTGRLRAAMDVTDPEPLPDGHPLWSAPGVLISPHVGGHTEASTRRGRVLVREQLARWAAGEQLANVVTGDY